MKSFHKLIFSNLLFILILGVVIPAKAGILRSSQLVIPAKAGIQSPVILTLSERSESKGKDLPPEHVKTGDSSVATPAPSRVEGLSQNDKTLGVDKALIDAALVGKDLVMDRRYDEALEQFEMISEKYPDSPTGAAGKVAIWQMRMFENEDLRFAKQFNEAEKAYEKIEQKKLREGELPVWDLFACGATDGVRGFFKGQAGRWWSALTNALHAVRLLKEVKWRAPDFVDVDLGLGTYIYWRSYFAKVMKVLPFFSDQRAAGIKMVENAYKNGKYAADVAEANLLFIYTFENRFDDAARLGDNLLAAHPKNLIFMFMRGKISYQQKKYDEALKYFDRVYAADPAISKALYYKGMALYQLKRFDEAKDIINAYIGMESAKDWLAWAYFRLGMVNEAQNDTNAAIRAYREAVKYDRGLKQAKKRLDELCR